MGIEKLHAACEPGGDDLAIFEKHLPFCLALKPGHPWLDRPDSFNPPPLKKSELIWIVGRHYDHVAAGLSDLKSLRLQPGSTGNVLRITELRCCDFFAPKISRRFNRAIGFDHKRGTAICRVGKNANLRA